MAYTLNCRLLSVVPRCRRIFQLNQREFILKTKTFSRHISLDNSIRYQEYKHDEYEKRLKSVPCLNLLNESKAVVLQDLCFENEERLKKAMAWRLKVFNYIAKNCKMYLSTLLLKSYFIYGCNMQDSSWNHWNSDEWTSASVLAWCIELIKEYTDMFNDVIDQNITRNGELCWYKQPEVGMRALNDALSLQYGIFNVIQKRFAGSKCYVNLMDDILKMSKEVVYGKALDMNFRMNQSSRSSLFTFENYRAITEYETTSICFCLPIFGAMHLAGGYSPNDFDSTKKLCLKLGLYSQSQVDYLKCFGKQEETAKSLENDIREGKCTWLSTKFLETASNPMKKQFMSSYGLHDEDAIAKVIELYKESKLVEVFKEFEGQIHAEIKDLLELMDDAKRYLFNNLLSEIQKEAK